MGASPKLQFYPQTRPPFRCIFKHVPFSWRLFSKRMWINPRIDECWKNGKINDFSPRLVEVMGWWTFIRQDRCPWSVVYNTEIAVNGHQNKSLSAIRSPVMSSTSNNKTDKEAHPDVSPNIFEVRLALREVSCIGRHGLQLQQKQHVLQGRTDDWIPGCCRCWLCRVAGDGAQLWHGQFVCMRWVLCVYPVDSVWSTKHIVLRYVASVCFTWVWRVLEPWMSFLLVTNPTWHSSDAWHHPDPQMSRWVDMAMLLATCSSKRAHNAE